jgi:drug/metabolite transporter (DMT)-like permease
MNTTFQRGALLALATALVSGVSVYVAKLGTQAVPDPFVYTTARNLVVGLALLAVLAASGRGAGLSGPRRGEWARLGLLALVGGSVPFLLFFWGLTMTSAPTASFLQKTQFLWVAGLAVPLLGEALGAWQALGLLALLAGTLVVGPAPTGFGPGEGLVLAATLLWSVEVVLARGLLRRVPPTLGALARMGGGAVVMLAFLGASGRLGELLALDAGQWLWVIGPALLLFGYVLTWYHALSRAPATVVTSILTIGAPITALLNGGMVSGTPLLGLGLLAAGAGLTALPILRRGAARPAAWVPDVA